MQYTEIFKVLKNENSQKKIFDIFLIFAQNIDCGYTLELPHRGKEKIRYLLYFCSKHRLWVHFRIALPMRFLRVPTIYVLEQK